MLSKGECEKALKNIELNYDAEYINECCDEFCMKMKSYITTLEQLIHEHFDNPPLSFDDLHEGMWVWDDKHSFYDQIISLHSPTPSSIETETWFTSFEENHFYRRQKEN